MGQLDDLLEANRLILEDLVPRMEGECIDCRVRSTFWPAALSPLP